MTRRVVVTGMGGVTSLGSDWPTIRANMEAGNTGVRAMADWARYTGVNTKLAAPIENFNIDDLYSRKKLRSMGRVSRLALAATETALAQAGLKDSPILTAGRLGVAYGSSFGSPDSVLGFYELKMNGQSKNLNATNYIRMMSQTTVVNLSVFYGITGRIIPASCACASGSMSIGYACEAIRWGKADVMIAGGAEELDITDSATFDTLFATSTRNSEPHLTPRPFDRDRDGLVIGEGGCTLVLEELEHARTRGAEIYAEILGFGTNADGAHITQPQAEKMSGALSLALADARLSREDIGFINAHGTATEEGDIAESQATYAVLGGNIPTHSLKSYFGHTLGACGAMETWLSIEMMRDGWFCPTANLENVDERCAPLDYVMKQPRNLKVDTIMSNNFAFGGINTSLVVSRF